MAYIDLNPVRAGIALAAEQLDFTSIQLRIKAAIKGEQPLMLLPFVGSEHQHKSTGIYLSLQDYLILVDETGRILGDDKRGFINSNAIKIIARLYQ
jgi:hypothetical protein